MDNEARELTVTHYPEDCGFKCSCGWTHTITKSGVTNGREVWSLHLREAIAAHDNLIRAGVRLAAAQIARDEYELDEKTPVDEGHREFRKKYGTVEIEEAILSSTTADEQAALDAHDAELLRKRTYKDFMDIFNDYQRMDRKTFDETHGDDISAALDTLVSEKVEAAFLKAGYAAITSIPTENSSFQEGFRKGQEASVNAIILAAKREGTEIAALKGEK